MKLAQVLFCLFLAACAGSLSSKTDKAINSINKDVETLEKTLESVSPDCLTVSVVKQIQDIKAQAVKIQQYCDANTHKLKEGILLRDLIIVALGIVMFLLLKK